MRSVLVASGFIGEAAYTRSVIRNHQDFCFVHGYDYVFHKQMPEESYDRAETQSPMSPFWQKASAIYVGLENGYKYVFWIDSDSVFQVMNRSLDDLLPMHDRYLCFTGDSWDLCNTGHMYVKQGEFTNEILNVWRQMRYRRFPRLATTHQDENGFLIDQAAFNVLLAGGRDIEDLVLHAKKYFNSINGFRGNPGRRHKLFQYTHAPTREWRIPLSRSLVDPYWRHGVHVVNSARLNSYPLKSPGAPGPKPTDPILHFAGGMKSLLVPWLVKHGY